MAAMGETLRAADFCLAATAAIARHARDRGKNALLHPNLLADEHVDPPESSRRCAVRFSARPHSHI